MSAAETQRIVAEELRHIPRGTLAQNAFRAAYSAYREDDLRKNPTALAEAALADAEHIICLSQRGFVPEFDRSFFSRAELTFCIAC